MHQATEIKRHQEGNKTRAKQLEGHGIRAVGTEFVRKQRSTSGHCDEEYEPSSEGPRRPPGGASRHAWKIL